MNKFMTGIYNLSTSVQPYVYILVAAALVAIGVLFIIPSDKTKQKATSAFPYVIIGSGICVLAVDLAKEIAGKFSF